MAETDTRLTNGGIGSAATVELDVLVGHPEHDLLFVASQVARMTGLKNPHNAPFAYKNLKVNQGVKWITLGALPELGSGLTDAYGRSLPATTSLFCESHVYQMMLRSKAPQTEPFCKRATEDLLPTIRKTGGVNRPRNRFRLKALTMGTEEPHNIPLPHRTTLPGSFTRTRPRPPRRQETSYPITRGNASQRPKLPGKQT